MVLSSSINVWTFYLYYLFYDGQVMVDEWVKYFWDWGLYPTWNLLLDLVYFTLKKYIFNF